MQWSSFARYKTANNPRPILTYDSHENKENKILAQRCVIPNCLQINLGMIFQTLVFIVITPLRGPSLESWRGPLTSSPQSHSE